MTPDTRLLLYALAAVGALILLIARFKLHPFIALVGVSLGLGLGVGMPPGTVVKAFQDGVGNVLGFIAIVVGLGTMLGKMMAESGAATRIAITLIGLFGERRVHWAIMFVAFIVGIPVFFQVGFVLLVPLVFTVARRTGMSLVKIGIRSWQACRWCTGCCRRIRRRCSRWRTAPTSGARFSMACSSASRPPRWRGRSSPPGLPRASRPR
jgi:GntP family gluconate:H+ symporter